MLRGGSEQAVTAQGGVAGPWLHRLLHFRTEFTLSNGEELQSEYLSPARQLEAVARMLRRRTRSAPCFSERARTVAADDLWLSGAQGRDTVALHFTRVRDEVAVRRAVRGIEEVLAPLGARPHWGKVSEMDARALAEAPPAARRLRRSCATVVPQRVFGNASVDRVLGGGVSRSTFPAGPGASGWRVWTWSPPTRCRDPHGGRSARVAARLGGRRGAPRRGPPRLHPLARRHDRLLRHHGLVPGPRHGAGRLRPQPWMPRPAATALVMVTLVLALVGFLWAFGSLLADQLTALVRAAPDIATDVLAWVNRVTGSDYTSTGCSRARA